MNRIIYCLIGYLLLIACSRQSPISGQLQLSSAENWQPTIYLIEARNLDELATSFVGTVLDSAKIDVNGRFSFEKMPQTTAPILLQLVVQQKGERFLNKLENEDLATANYFPIIWQTGEILKITADITHFQNSFSIQNPSVENEALLALRDIRKQAYEEFSGKIVEDNHGEAILEQADALHHFRQPLITFAEESDYLLPALVATRWVSPNNDYERVPEFLVNQCEKWQVKAATHPWVEQLCQKADRTQLPILIGDKIPDFSMPMLSGDTLALQELIAGKLTLIDLWASWCAPCRSENKTVLVPLWDKYHAEGFQIIGYALDGTQKVWERAIETDGANRWLHASHLRGDDAPLLEKLRLETIPANILLDGEGKIVAKNLHGKALVEFVKTYFEF